MVMFGRANDRSVSVVPSQSKNTSNVYVVRLTLVTFPGNHEFPLSKYTSTLVPMEHCKNKWETSNDIAHDIIYRKVNYFI